MKDTKPRRLAGVLLILTPIAFNLLFTLLSMTFEYPDILREPAGYVLERFDAGGAGLVATWYGFMLTAVLFVPLVILVHRVLAGDGREAGEPFYLGLAPILLPLGNATQSPRLLSFAGPSCVAYSPHTHT